MSGSASTYASPRLDTPTSDMSGHLSGHTSNLPRVGSGSSSTAWSTTWRPVIAAALDYFRTAGHLDPTAGPDVLPWRSAAAFALLRTGDGRTAAGLLTLSLDPAAAAARSGPAPAVPSE